jgi:hypothetical protein
MSATRGGIFYNLPESRYNITLVYCTSLSIQYFFSSPHILQKFLDRMIGKREDLNRWLAITFGYTIDVGVYSDLILYSKLETRGFYIKINGEEVSCQNNIILNGVTVILPNSTGKYPDSMKKSVRS